jgi:hypothetical protein
MRAGESRQPLTSEVQKGAVRKALSLSIWDGVFANLYVNLTGGVFLVGYALALKATEVQIGLLAAFPQSSARERIWGHPLEGPCQ